METAYARRDFDRPVVEVRHSHADHHHPVAPGREILQELHPAPLLIAAGALTAVVAIFGLGFMGPMDFTIAMMINGAVLIGFLAIPYLFARVSGALDRRGPSWGEFVRGYFDTFTGPMPAGGAAVLVVTVPLCLLGAAIAFTVIFHILS